MTYKTPGVYITEVPLFPPSVAQVETAIPAFVGYTEKAKGGDDAPLANTAVRIKSFVEFQSLFGGQYKPVLHTVIADATKGNELVSTAPDKRFYLYDVLRQFYDNGGGACYIVSVGSFSDAIDFNLLKAGFDKIGKVDEPTLLLTPDGVGLQDSNDEPDLSKYSDLQKLLLNQCADLQDRFAVLDILEGYLPTDASNTPIKDFRNNIGINNLSYGAAYYPWIITSYSYDISFRQLQIFDKADLSNAVTDFDPYAKNDNEKSLVATAVASIADTDSTLNITGTEKTALKTKGKGHLKELLAGFQLKITADTNIASNLTAYLNMLNRIAVAFATAESSALAGSGLSQEISLIQQDTDLTAALIALIAIEKNPKTIANTNVSRDAAQVKTLYTPLEPGWLGGSTFDAITADSTDFPADNTGSLEIIDALTTDTEKILNSYQRLLTAALHFEKLADDALFSSHQFFNGARDLIVEKMRTLPPSGTIAGIYAAVDSNRGVWKAPANVSINYVVGPAVKLDNSDQDDMNVSTSGKSVNAIRAFTGKGTLVWGSRTLAGNDNEWRYVPVRRFFVMVEESVKKATEPFVFEPNDANTWVKVKAMIENFLTLQWRAGALQGAKPEEAFFVNVGLGETMTAQDILEGRMIVEIGMAAVRPAEFIILRFSHMMQTATG